MSSNLQPIARILSSGLGATLQDFGRSGYGRFGIPKAGFMDSHAASWANKLLFNPPHTPVLELMLQGAAIEWLIPAWIAITGADQSSHLPLWKTIQIRPGDHLLFPRNKSGIWTYIAVAGGFTDPENTHFGSVSGDANARLGVTLHADSLLYAAPAKSFSLPSSIASRSTPWTEIRDYRFPPPLKVFSGPQQSFFSDQSQNRLVTTDWTVTSRCDRTGYRLLGPRIQPTQSQIHSEAVLPGSIQVPPDGQPIITMNDGPTVGGYPKIGIIAPADLAWLAQARPGTKVRFTPANPDDA